MLKTFRASRSNVVVWILMGFLIVGLAGFGITFGGAGGQPVATVGEARIEPEQMTRALDQELRAISNQIGRNLPMTEARQFGVDRMVLARLISDATLDDAAERLGLSTGDGKVQEMVLATPAFRGADGQFDRAAYSFALERTGLTAAEFEESLRAEATRELLAGSLQSAVAMPSAAAETLLAYAGETRRFDWFELTPAMLTEPTPAPTDAELTAFHDANVARYTRPETRKITYAILSPEALAATIEVPEAELRAAYDAAKDRYDLPERRVVDRIGFATTEEAAAALARVQSGAIDFDALAAERGLTAATIDQGELTRDALAEPAAGAIFGAAEPGIVGPVDTPLGPSLYRINAILAAQTTPFEAAREELRAERALVEAKARIADEAAPVDDMIAGGARLEEIAEQTDFDIGTIDLSAETTGGLADDASFRQLVDQAELDEETDLHELGSGAMIAIRLDAVEEPAPIPLAEIRDRAAADWTAEKNGERLAALAEGLVTEIDGGAAIADVAARLGATVASAGPIARGDLVPEAPTGLVAAAFAAAPDKAAQAADGGRVAIARVTEVKPFDLAAPDNVALAGQVTDQIAAQAAEDALALYVAALQEDVGVTVNQELLGGLLAQFP